jgi:O-acetyl-ADP-ribose deacetylase (regulator of RNase III)
MKIPITKRAMLSLVQGDITLQSADAIVNAANSSLMGGGGVDGAIHRAGGPAILEECKRIREESGPLLPGRAVSTTAGNLPAKFVFHAVGPVWQGGNQGESKVLASCYQYCLRLAHGMRLRSIVFPSISTGAFGYPVDLAAPLAIDAIRVALVAGASVEDVTFCLFDPNTLSVYEKAARELFGPSATNGSALRFTVGERPPTHEDT